MYRILTAESTSVLSCKIHEIPTVYRSLHLEASELRGQMEEAERGSVGYLALRMCKFKGRKGYTKFATLWCSLCAGVESALRLMERQSVLWACLYARHFSVTHNECNNHGYFILAGKTTMGCTLCLAHLTPRCAGPPDVGKSMAASAFLSSIATGLQTTSDGASKLAHTSDDRDSDLRCEFQDELKSLLSASGNDEASSAHSKAAAPRLTCILDAHTTCSQIHADTDPDRGVYLQATGTRPAHPRMEDRDYPESRAKNGREHILGEPGAAMD